MARPNAAFCAPPATFDTLDRVTLSRAAAGLRGWRRKRQDGSLGGQDDYSRVEGEFYKPYFLRKNTVVPRVTAGIRTSGAPLPYYDRFALGGFLNLRFTRADLPIRIQHSPS